MSEIRRELAEGKELRSSKAKEKLPDEALAGIQGAGWYPATTIDTGETDKFFDIWVIWRTPGEPDLWCTVESVTETDGEYTYFDLYCPAQGYIYYDVPASQVLVDCID